MHHGRAQALSPPARGHSAVTATPLLSEGCPPMPSQVTRGERPRSGALRHPVRRPRDRESLTNGHRVGYQVRAVFPL